MFYHAAGLSFAMEIFSVSRVGCGPDGRRLARNVPWVEARALEKPPLPPHMHRLSVPYGTPRWSVIDLLGQALALAY